jgi:cytochrome P450
MFSVSFVTVEQLSIAGVCLLILVLSLIFLRRKDNSKLPPLNKEGTFQTIQIFMNGKGAPEFFFETMKELGSVYRLRMPESSHWISVCDPALARKLLSEEEEKPKMVERMNGFTNFVPNIASKPSHSESFKVARKGIAPSFSTMNICLSLPQLYSKIDVLKKVFLNLESNSETFDLPQIMTQLTMDFICSGSTLD